MINGIKALKFGVEDVAKAVQYLQDFGLSEVKNALSNAHCFRTQNGAEVQVYSVDDERLPAAFESGSTLREVIWAVNRDSDMEVLALTLQDAPSYQRTADSIVCQDPNGMFLRFEVGSLTYNAEAISEGINQYGQINRINAPSPVYTQAEPMAIGHVVFFTPDLETTQAFYEDKLGFHLSDAYNQRGAFLRCSSEGWHHSLFLLKLPHKPNAGLNHVAFVVRDIHEVIGGGLNMNRLKWDSFIGPGRHPISSAYFWYVHSPLGGAFEYYTNDDYLTAQWEPRFYDYSLELFTEWAIDGGLDHETRRQAVSAKD